jgi:transcription elongation regulator 1
MKQFRDLLTEKEISAFSTWEKELHKIVFDPRYLLLTSKERKQVFDKYVRERAEEERREKKSKLKEKRETYKKLIEEAGTHGKSSFSEFASKHSKDDRFKLIEKMREREALFNEYLIDARKREKEEREVKRKTSKKEFMVLLKETTAIDRHCHWSEVKKTIDSDPRYKAVESSSQREDWFLDHVHDLKEEHRREKEKKKKNRSRSRSRSPRGKKRSRSRSRSKDKKGKKKDKRASRSRSRDKKKRDRDESEDKARRSDKEEGEMSDDTDADKRKSLDESKKRSSRERNSREKSKDSDDGGGDKKDKEEEEEDKEETEEDRLTKEKKDNEERVAASLRKREEEVQKELSGHLHARDKERQQHRHHEAISNFQALLTDLIRHPDFSWKEAKRVLKKDGRYDSVATLEKPERERLFDDHIDLLIAKKKENYWKLLAECKEIKLDATFKEVKKQIRDDPRYTKFSSSDRKCEKQFTEFLKDKVSKAKQGFRELLMETKKINDKSLSLVKEDGGGTSETGHMSEILELLNKDKRFLDLECIGDDRTKILMLYLEDQERRGPPPPPTASEPGRRGAK